MSFGPASTWAANLGPIKSITLSEGKLPLRAVLFLSDKLVVAAGYDCTPMLFEAKLDIDIIQSWSFKAELSGEGKLVNNSNGGKRHSQFISGLAVFKAHSDLGFKASNAASVSLTNKTPATTLVDSPHNNCVQCMRQVVISKCPAEEHVSTFTTSSLDGMLVLWTVGLLDKR